MAMNFALRMGRRCMNTLRLRVGCHYEYVNSKHAGLHALIPREGTSTVAVPRQNLLCSVSLRVRTAWNRRAAYYAQRRGVDNLEDRQLPIEKVISLVRVS